MAMSAATTALIVFGSESDAQAARQTLAHAGFGDQVEISADFMADPLAAEAPGQAYENQSTSSSGSGVVTWIKSAFSSLKDSDTADAKRMADIQRGGAVLTVTGNSADIDRFVQLVQEHQPVTVHYR